MPFAPASNLNSRQRRQWMDSSQPMQPPATAGGGGRNDPLSLQNNNNIKNNINNNHLQIHYSQAPSPPPPPPQPVQMTRRNGWPLQKSKRHRRRVPPVGPAGRWFKQHKQVTRRGSVASSRNENPQNVNDQVEEDDDEEEEGNFYQKKKMKINDDGRSSLEQPTMDNNDAKKTCCSSAWMAMQCEQGWCIPHIPPPPPPVANCKTNQNTRDYEEIVRRYNLLRPHVPSSFLLIPDVAYRLEHERQWNLSCLSGNPQYPSHHHQQQQIQRQRLSSSSSSQVVQEELGGGKHLMVLVDQVVTHHWLLWTVTLKDDTGASLQAWIDPELVQEEQQHYLSSSSSSPAEPSTATAIVATGTNNHSNKKKKNKQQKLVQEGYVWHLVNCPVMLRGPAEDPEDGLVLGGGEGGEDVAMTAAAVGAVASSNSGEYFGGHGQQQQPRAPPPPERTLLVGKENIVAIWTPEQADEIDDVKFTTWLEKRNSISVMSTTTTHTTTTTKRRGEREQQVQEHDEGEVLRENEEEEDADNPAERIWEEHSDEEEQERRSSRFMVEHGGDGDCDDNRMKENNDPVYNMLSDNNKQRDNQRTRSTRLDSKSNGTDRTAATTTTATRSFSSSSSTHSAYPERTDSGQLTGSRTILSSQQNERQQQQNPHSPTRRKRRRQEEDTDQIHKRHTVSSTVPVQHSLASPSSPGLLLMSQPTTEEALTNLPTNKVAQKHSKNYNHEHLTKPTFSSVQNLEKSNTSDSDTRRYISLSNNNETAEETVIASNARVDKEVQDKQQEEVEMEDDVDELLRIGQSANAGGKDRTSQALWSCAWDDDGSGEQHIQGLSDGDDDVVALELEETKANQPERSDWQHQQHATKTSNKHNGIKKKKSSLEQQEHNTEEEQDDNDDSSLDSKLRPSFDFAATATAGLQELNDSDLAWSDDEEE